MFTALLYSRRFCGFGVKQIDFWVQGSSVIELTRSGPGQTLEVEKKNCAQDCESLHFSHEEAFFQSISQIHFHFGQARNSITLNQIFLQLEKPNSHLRGAL